ncbi:hypothetical protein MPER_08749, partial [Moniliophthora perniciosa FA553]
GDLSGATTQTVGDAPMDFGSWGCPDISGSGTGEASYDIARNPAAMDIDLTSLNDPSDFRPNYDANTDMAALIAMTTAPFSTPMTSDEFSLSMSQVMPSGTPSLVASPMPSMSSIGDFPMTPISPVAVDFNGGPDATVGMSHDLGVTMNAVSSLMALGGESGSTEKEKEKTQSSTSTSPHQTRQGGEVDGMNPSGRAKRPTDVIFGLGQSSDWYTHYARACAYFQ